MHLQNCWEGGTARGSKIRVFKVPAQECIEINIYLSIQNSDARTIEHGMKSIYKFGLSVCLFVSNKRQNGWTDRAQIFCGTSRDPRGGLWMIKFSKICLHQNSIFENFENPRNFFLKIREIFCFYYLLTRRSPVYFIFTNEIKYRREAP